MLKTDQSKFNNDWYDTGGGILLRTIWYFVNVAIFMNPWIPFMGIKVRILRAFGAKVGKGLILKPSVNIKYPWRLTIGDHVWIGENVWIDNLADVRIADNVCISQGAMLLCGNHNYKKTTFDLMIGAITLEEGAWVGARTTVCPGVTLHSHAILSVGSIATHNLEPYTIYQGVPAVAVKKRVIAE